MAQLRAYLGFDGNCREAMNFYKEVFGGELQIMTFGDSQMPGNSPEMKDKIMHSALMNGTAIYLMGSDMIMERGIVKGNNVSLCLIGESKEELRILFQKLSEGGKIGNDLKDEFFGFYGDLTDKFGFNWMFQYSEEDKAS